MDNTASQHTSLRTSSHYIFSNPRIISELCNIFYHERKFGYFRISTHFGGVSALPSMDEAKKLLDAARERDQRVKAKLASQHPQPEGRTGRPFSCHTCKKCPWHVGYILSCKTTKFYNITNITSASGMCDSLLPCRWCFLKFLIE